MTKKQLWYAATCYEGFMNSSDANSKFDLILRVIEAAALASSEKSFLDELSPVLHLVLEFDFLQLVVEDQTTHRTWTRVVESNLTDRGWEELLARDSSAALWGTVCGKPQILIDELELQCPALAELLRPAQLQLFCISRLSTQRGRFVALVLGRRQNVVCTPFEVRVLKCIAAQIAVAVDDELTQAAALEYQIQLQQERDHLRALLDVTNAIVSKLELEPMLAEVSRSIRKVITSDYANLLIHITESNELYEVTLDCPADVDAIHLDKRTPIGDDPASVAFRTIQPVVASRGQLIEYAKRYEVISQILAGGARATCSVPLVVHGRPIGVFNVMTRKKDSFEPRDVDVLQEVAGQLAIAVDNALAYRQISELKDKLASEKLYLEEEIRINLDELVGESSALKDVLRQVEIVAASDTTVLILGETGTGKELIARAVHNLSARKKKNFVKLNCASIPTGLLESELFGHERGAFTSAVAQRIGRFELAHHGTLFLDEVGDIPLELQPKLLRALQEQEFERLGGTRTIKVDVRLIAATNQNLRTMVSEKKFRSDLFYRLNVFPITLPPLRDRKGDIPLLVRYFTQKFAKKMNRNIKTIPSSTLQALEQWHWPGNIRELENLVERAVLLSQSSYLNVPLADLMDEEGEDTAPPAPPSPGKQVKSLKGAEREMIVQALREANGIMSGPRGAAARLGLSRSTLQSKMRRLQITSRDYSSESFQ